MTLVILYAYIFLSVILEMLPISSSSHLFFFIEFLKKNYQFVPDESLVAAFDFLVHGITLSVLAFFLKSVFGCWRVKYAGTKNGLPVLLHAGLLLSR